MKQFNDMGGNEPNSGNSTDSFMHDSSMRGLGDDGKDEKNKVNPHEFLGHETDCYEADCFERDWSGGMLEMVSEKERCCNKKGIVEEAIFFALEAHAGMTRKGNCLPYILHPVEVASIVSHMTEDENTIAAAVLHDVLEDTEITLEELEEKFGPIAELVEAETENKRRDLPSETTWKIRKQETIERLKTETRIEVKMIALADKLSNIRSIHRMQKKLGDKIWERFNQKDMSEQGWYYLSIAKALSDLRQCSAWREYVWLIELVFGENILLW